MDIFTTRVSLCRLFLLYYTVSVFKNLKAWQHIQNLEVLSEMFGNT
jgi:hypothetical protein